MGGESWNCGTDPGKPEVVEVAPVGSSCWNGDDVKEGNSAASLIGERILDSVPVRDDFVGKELFSVPESLFAPASLKPD